MYKRQVHKRDNRFNRHSDLIVLPEIMVESTAPLLQKSGVRYTILVQNAFYVSQGAMEMNQVAALYEGATSIVSTSEDITMTLGALFQNLRTPIFNINYAFDPRVFASDGTKRNLITYMPRKLPYHSRMVVRYLLCLLYTSRCV